MADLIEDPKKKKASFGDAAAAAADPGVMRIGGAARPAPMAMPAAPDIGPFVGKPGDFPVNPDGTPMMKPAAGLGAVAPAPTERPPAHSTSTLAAPSSTEQPQSDYARQMGELGGFLGAIPGKVAKWFVSAPGSDGMLSFDKQPAATPDMSAYVTRMKPDQYGARSATMPVKSDSPLPVMSVAPEPDALPSSAVAPISAGAVKTQGQMNMEADLKSAEAMKAERLAAEGRAPQAVVTHSGNDWQARNNLRNLEVSASSLTAQPQDVQAYIDARKHDTSLQGGGTAADIANVAAANRNNEINSTAQVANARTAQQGQQFGASHELATQRLALDSRKADIADAGSKMDNATKKQLQDLSAQIMKETDPAKLAVLQDKYQTITGKYQRPDPAARELYKAVTDPVTGKVTMYNTQTGELGTGQQAPYPEGTRLTGPDKKAYIVKNGVPVPA